MLAANSTVKDCPDTVILKPAAMSGELTTGAEYVAKALRLNLPNFEVRHKPDVKISNIQNYYLGVVFDDDLDIYDESEWLANNIIPDVELRSNDLSVCIYILKEI